MDNKKVLLTSSALLILNFVIKILFIRTNSIAGDEPFTIYHAQMDIPSIIYYLKFCNNPPLFEIMLHYWIKVFGIGDLSVRFLPLLFSTATVFFIFRIGYRFFNYNVALVASLLFTFSNYQVIFSHESRVYSLFALLTAMSMYFFFEIIHHSKEKKYFVALIITNTLLIYAHYFGGFVIIIQFLSVLSISSLRKQFLKTYFFLITITILLYIPQLKVLFSRFGISAQQGTWLKSPSGAEELYNMLVKFSNKPVTTICCLAILASALIKVIIKKDYENAPANKINTIVVSWFFFPFIFMFLISFRLPMFLDRYLIYISIGYYFTLAIAATYVLKGKKIAQFIAPALLVLAFIVTFNPNVYNKRSLADTVAKIKSLKDDKTSVLICAFDFTTGFAYYYDRNIFMDVDNADEYGNMIAELNKQNIYPVHTMNPDYIHTDKILYLDAAADFTDSGNNILKTLNRDYKLVNIYRFPEIFNIYEFRKNG